MKTQGFREKISLRTFWQLWLSLFFAIYAQVNDTFVDTKYLVSLYLLELYYHNVPYE